jgi:dynein light intermediate chain 1
MSCPSSVILVKWYSRIPLTMLQDREASRSNEPETPMTPPPNAQDPGKMDNDKLMSFFSGLINKGTSSATNSPRGA